VRWRAAPARQVFRTRSAASLYAPICGMNLLNGLLWTAYGSATAQPFVYGPNAFGAALALFQVALCCLFRSKSPRRAPATALCFVEAVLVALQRAHVSAGAPDAQVGCCLSPL